MQTNLPALLTDEEGFKYRIVGEVGKDGAITYSPSFFVKDCGDCIYCGFKSNCRQCVQISFKDSIKDYFVPIPEAKHQEIFKDYQEKKPQPRFEFSKKAVSR